MDTPRATVAVIGGTGFYRWLDDAETVEIRTPYGAPSGPVHVGTVAGRGVAFLARHGERHSLAPHAINHRANLWALRSLGVRQVLAPCAVGSLRPSVAPGSLVVPDQLVDRTSGRIQTFVETGATHVPFADPYCARLGSALADADPQVRRGGTMVVIDGPRFSTRAESRWYAAQGWDLVNMTGHPEAVLAREMLLCYSPLALVTDLDAGVDPGDGVDEQEVYALFAANLARLGDVLTATIKELPDPDGCRCSSWADGLQLAYGVPGRAER
ncbi:MAG TPA: S-methyl-5'-thioadenosine phosphorylase [Nocardioides sp.]|nr:S-methyl-5'-thioadenosine phosphorylase [Nocardioides sp.]